MAMDDYPKHLDDSQGSLPCLRDHLDTHLSPPLYRSSLSSDTRSFLDHKPIFSTPRSSNIAQSHFSHSVVSYLREEVDISNLRSATTRDHVRTDILPYKGMFERPFRGNIPWTRGKCSLDVDDEVCRYRWCTSDQKQYRHQRNASAHESSLTNTGTQVVSNHPKVSNIHQLLNDEGFNNNPHSRLSAATLHSNETNSRKQPQSPIRTPSLYRYYPYFPPSHLGTTRINDCSGLPHYYNSGYYNTPDYRTYGYRPVGFLEGKNHTCKYPGCNMRFKRLEHLKRHYRVHTMEKPFQCTYEGCDKAFSRSDNLSQHLKTHERRAQKQSQYKPS